MRSAGVAALALLAAGCVAAPEPTRLGLPAAMPAPAPVAGRDWHLSQYDGESSLAYGVAESDDVAIAFGCAHGSGRVFMFRDAPDDAPREFRLEAAGETARFAAESEPSMLTDGQMLSAQAASDAPVFRQFRSVGWLAVWTGDIREAHAPQPGSETRADRFFAACG